MAKYKTTDAAAGQGLFLTVNLKEQLLPGTFEYMLNEIIGTKIDISCFDNYYKNDLTGASAIPPAALLKLVIYGYLNGCISSRQIWNLNRRNIVAKALTNDMPIHWTTIADFISRNPKEFKEVFVKALTYGNELGLIGGETCAIDGLRLPSNASMDMSGTEAQLKERLEAYQKMAAKHVERHLRKDAQGEADEDTERRYEQRQKKLKGQIEKLCGFLETMEKKEGQRGQEIISNVTDNESAMIHSSKGYVQGYIGIAIVDQKSQMITSAQAYGTANETEHLAEMLDKNAENLEAAGGVALEEGQRMTLLGDANYFSEGNLQACEERGIDAVVPDSQVQRRVGADREKRYEAYDFTYHEDGDYYECPQGKPLECKGAVTFRGGNEGTIYQASLTDCKACAAYSHCIWTKKEKSKKTQGKKLVITERNKAKGAIQQMQDKLATVEYQDKYAYRIGIVEPVFADIRYCKGLDRFMLRGAGKVNGQWQLFCVVHNLFKILKGFNMGLNCA